MMMAQPVALDHVFLVLMVVVLLSARGTRDQEWRYRSTRWTLRLSSGGAVGIHGVPCRSVGGARAIVGLVAAGRRTADTTGNWADDCGIVFCFAVGATSRGSWAAGALKDGSAETCQCRAVHAADP